VEKRGFVGVFACLKVWEVWNLWEVWEMQHLEWRGFLQRGERAKLELGDPR
jgi:hypothetical protein